MNVGMRDTLAGDAAAVHYYIEPCRLVFSEQQVSCDPQQFEARQILLLGEIENRGECILGMINR